MQSMEQTPAEKAIADTRRWLERAVIGLELCPFARPVHLQDRIRYCVSEATAPEALLEQLQHELTLLNETDPALCETTLLIHPQVLGDFLDYNDFLGIAETLVSEMGLEGTLQVASFHPHYRFEGTGEDDIDNYTNRSPHPTLHLLREESVSRALEAFPDAERIYQKNIDTLRRLGHAGWQRLWTDESPKT